MTMNDSAILLVEDRNQDEILTLRAFKKNSILNPVVVARDGAEALDILFATGSHAGSSPVGMPGLVLLDLSLPKVGGIDVLRRIRASPRTSLLPVVILSSSSEKRDLLACYSTGANSYIVKPVDYTQFSDAVRQIGQYWLGLNESPPAATI